MNGIASSMAITVTIMFIGLIVWMEVFGGGEGEVHLEDLEKVSGVVESVGVKKGNIIIETTERTIVLPEKELEVVRDNQENEKVTYYTDGYKSVKEVTLYITDKTIKTFSKDYAEELGRNLMVQ